MGLLLRVYELFCLHLLILHYQNICCCAQLCSQDQSSALLHFKQLFSFDKLASPLCEGCLPPPYPKMMYWREDTDCCSWDGITCDSVTGHVIGLDLSCSWLSGTITSKSSLFHLPHLQWLNLAYNNFHSSQLSSDFALFANLTYLNLSSSHFFGLVPSELSHLSKLASLDLSGNFELILETPVMESLAQNLTKLNVLILDFIDMSLVVPGSLINLSSSLTSLSLINCGLQGKFPENIFRLTNLQMLKLAANFDLTGSFPKVNWSSPLSLLDVSSTSFSGELPDSIGNLKFLRSLNLSDCNFFGSVPESLGKLTDMTHLVLSSNNFSGEIPSSLSNLEQLIFLDLSHNNFTGQIPDIFVKLTKLSGIDFSLNQLTGPIPSHVNALPKLASLYLNGNSLNGSIPSRLFTLPLLESVDLSSNRLNGHIHDEFHYNSLRTLDLSDNMLYGSIPGSIFELVNLTDLTLSSNNLRGIVELSRFAKFKNLERLNLSHNSLSLSTNINVNSSFPKLCSFSLSSCNISEFPDILKTQEKLVLLDLSNNKIVDRRSNLLEGPVPVPPISMEISLDSSNELSEDVPSFICNLISLAVLDLSNNSLSGLLPKCLGNFSKGLTVLNLRMNNFSGSIPGTFAEGNGLKNLGLNGNQLEGPLPKSLVNCTSLQVLDLGNNKINDTFPHWLESLPQLQVLILRSNRFHGQIGKLESRFSFTKLRIIDLSHNDFTGVLPTRLFENLQAMMNADEQKSEAKYMGQGYYEDSVIVTMKGLELKLTRILTIFTTIDMSSNRFQGKIPGEVGKFKSLLVLNFSHNSLTGHIPSSLENITALESLDLSCNNLDGKIPEQLTSLTFLEVLNLSNNQLVGLIPQGRQFNTFGNDSYRGNSGLCGLPLSKKCSNDEAAPPPPSHEDKDFGSEFDWKITLMGYGCGLVFGLSMGYIVFSTGKPQWFVRLIEGDRQKKVRRTRQRRQVRRN